MTTMASQRDLATSTYPSAPIAPDTSPPDTPAADTSPPWKLARRTGGPFHVDLTFVPQDGRADPSAIQSQFSDEFSARLTDENKRITRRTLRNSFNFFTLFDAPSRNCSSRRCFLIR